MSPHYAWVQRLFSLIPGARGYLRREKMREADILIRRFVAERVSAAAGLAAQAAGRAFFATMPSLTPVPPGVESGAGLAAYHQRLMDLAVRLDSLASDVLYADSGWAPVSAVQAIREDVIEGLCKLDDSMIGPASGIEEAARAVKGCVEAGLVYAEYLWRYRAEGRWASCWP